MISLSELEKKFSANGIPPYRARQVYRAVCREGIDDFSRITTIPADLRKSLPTLAHLYSMSLQREVRSPSGDAEKILFRLNDGIMIETVIMGFSDGRNSVCVSSQAGCRLGCRFCATGASGFKRDLGYEEIFDQALFCSNLLLKQGKRMSNVVYMGMGEPFMNYDNVLASVRCLNDPAGMNLGARSITLSTSGICEGIDRLAGEKIQVNLAVSLHAPNQKLRESIMPVAKIHNLNDLMASIRRYISMTNRRVTYEYVMLEGINDLPVHARELASLLKGQLCHINLIPYNATGIAGIKGSSRSSISLFRESLKSAGIPVTVRVSLGQDIMAACGQLAGKQAPAKRYVKRRA